MSEHTNGPWEVVRTDAGIIVRTESAKKTRAGASRYAAIGGFDRSDPEQLAEALANARLIAGYFQIADGKWVHARIEREREREHAQASFEVDGE